MAGKLEDSARTMWCRLPALSAYSSLWAYHTPCAGVPEVISSSALGLVGPIIPSIAHAVARV